ncbi:MAG: hemerythrin family protein [Bacteroidales bacterium]|nr:hemerythrin family protein [Bacteroidales bacterium]
MEGKLKHIKWQPEYEFQIEAIDQSHRKLVNLINRLGDMINRQACPESMSEIFFSLIHYAERYLIQEEILLRDLGYPQLDQHKEKHHFFIEKIKSFRDEFSSRNPDICQDLYDFLSEWFRDHILKYDREIITFLKGKGIS